MSTKRFLVPLIALAFSANAAADQKPAHVRIITSDITLFLRAKAIADSGPPSERPEIYKKEYLERGSIGLKDFVAAHKIADEQTLAKEVDTEPRYYTSLAALPRHLHAMQPTFDRVFTGLRRLYPPAKVPNLYFVVGHLWSSGTVSTHGMLLGAEVWGVTPTTPLHEFVGKKRGWVHPLKDVPYNVAHEVVHLQ